MDYTNPERKTFFLTVQSGLIQALILSCYVSTGLPPYMILQNKLKIMDTFGVISSNNNEPRVFSYPEKYSNNNYLKTTTLHILAISCVLKLSNLLTTPSSSRNPPITFSIPIKKDCAHHLINLYLKQY